jgi:hypothetical protein
MLKLLLISLAGLLTFTSCSSSNVNVDYNSETDFYAFMDYKFAPAEKGFESQLLYARIKSSIRAKLAEKGLNEVSDNEDVIIRFIVTKESTYSTVTTGSSYGRRRYRSVGMTSTRVIESPQAVLVIEFINTKNKEVLWQGSTFTSISKKMPPKEKDEKVKAVVDEILDEYPPGFDGHQ